MGLIKRSTFARLGNAIQLDNDPKLTNAQLLLTNHDLKPVEPARRQWKSWNFVAFWIADCFNVNTWLIASASVTAGLSWWQAWLCVWVGYTFTGALVCTTGRIGATYHISFPVVCRSSFGVWGSLWPVLNRVVMSCIWYGVVCWVGGECVFLMIRSIWPSWSEYAAGGIHNTFPSSSGTDTAHYVSYFLFWFGSLPFLWFPVHKIRHLFTVKAYVVPVCGVAFFIWTLVKAKGAGPVIREPSKLHGSALAWEMISGIMSAIANFATLIVNDPDFARFARKPKDALWSQLFTIPLGFAFTSLIGVLVSSAASVLYGHPIWNPLTLLYRFLEEPDAGSGTRFGVFIIAAAFTLAQLGVNISANSISAGTDMTALLPRYLNIRRGSYICAAVGLAMCPWHLLGSASKFTTYLSAYSVFLSSIAGVMVADYYFVKKGYLQIKDLYSAEKNGPYYYRWGVHWRAYVSYIAGILINIVGFVGVLGAKVPIGAQYIYRVNYVCGFLVSSICYYMLCRFSPIPATSDTWRELHDHEMDADVFLGYALENSDSEEAYRAENELKTPETKVSPK